MIHRNAKRTWIELEDDGQHHKFIFVIETDLVVDSSLTDFDSSDFDDLVNAASDYMKAQPHIDGIRIVPQR